MKCLQICGLVDAYSAGAFIVSELASRGLKVIHIQSSKNIPKYYEKSFIRDNFIDNLVFDDNLEDILTKLRYYNPLFIFAGCEPGVSFADILRHRLNLYPNDIGMSPARRNKYEMIKALQDAGLHTANQYRSKNVSEILNWIHSSQKWPIVIKPLDSAGTDNVVVCSSEEEVKTAFQQIMGKINLVGLKNEEVLAQSFLNGEEYIVNFVSWEGQHLMSDIWHMPKKIIKGAGRIYDRSELMEMDGKIQDEIKRYIAKVLDALKIKYGPSHCEIMFTRDGPALIEIGARVDGGNVYINKKKIKIFDRHQIELTVDAFFSPKDFLNRINKPNKIVRYAMEVCLRSDKNGTLKNYKNLDKIERLSSFWEMHLKLAPGDKLKRTVDMSTAPGVIWLAHDDKSQLFSDYDAIRNLENDLYVLL